MAAAPYSITPRRLARSVATPSILALVLVISPTFEIRLVAGLIGVILCLWALRREFRRLADDVAWRTALEIAANPQILFGIADEEKQ
jgi:lysylphosphatidylglycerol synthetase-like protein (DUF2156 family)